MAVSSDQLLRLANWAGAELVHHWPIMRAIRADVKLNDRPADMGMDRDVVDKSEESCGRMQNFDQLSSK